MVYFIDCINVSQSEIRDLAADLKSLNLYAYDSRKIGTLAITQVVFNWAKECNWSPKLEYKIPGVYNERKTKKSLTLIESLYFANEDISQQAGEFKLYKRGDAIADVFINRDSFFPGQSLPPLIIEIDRTNKRWSLKKLEKCAEKGWDCLWIRWGSPKPIPIPKNVMCIYIPFTGK